MEVAFRRLHKGGRATFGGAPTFVDSIVGDGEAVAVVVAVAVAVAVAMAVAAAAAYTPLYPSHPLYPLSVQVAKGSVQVANGSAQVANGSVQVATTNDYQRLPTTTTDL